MVDGINFLNRIIKIFEKVKGRVGAVFDSFVSIGTSNPTLFVFANFYTSIILFVEDVAQSIVVNFL